MSDNKKRKKDKVAKKGSSNESSPNKLAKEEDSIARFVRFNCPSNTTMFEENEVHYFSGKKAVNLLVDSKKYGVKAKVPKFATSEEAGDFLQMLLEKGLFFRAKKMVLIKKKDKSGQELKVSKTRDVSKSPKVDKKEKKKVKIDEEEQAGGELEEKEQEEKSEQEEDKKRKKKVKLLFNEVQAFDADTNDVYVWVFDPTPFWKKCVGVLIVLGTIGGCLFPLWPEWLRLGVYYLSVTGIALFGVLLGVALARTILYALIWLFTLGRHHLWVLPNLMEDCGFFESFQPFYTYEHVPGGFFAKNEPKKKKKEGETAKEEEGEKEPLLKLDEDKGEDMDMDIAAPNEPGEGREPKTVIESEEASEETKEEEKEEQLDEEEEADAQSDSNSNSWERLSENSQKSETANNDQRKKD